MFEPASTSEEALARYQQGYRESSVETVLSVINFVQEAKLTLHAGAVSAVESFALERAAELRRYYLEHGFAKGLNVGNSTFVAKFENAPDQHTFVLRDEQATGVNVFRLAFRRHERGWYLVRG